MVAAVVVAAVVVVYTEMATYVHDRVAVYRVRAHNYSLIGRLETSFRMSSPGWRGNAARKKMSIATRAFSRPHVQEGGEKN